MHKHEGYKYTNTGLCWLCGFPPEHILHGEEVPPEVNKSGRLVVKKTCASPRGLITLDVNVSGVESAQQWLRVAELMAAMRALSESVGQVRIP